MKIEDLKAQLDNLGIKYHHKAGVKKLSELLEQAARDTPREDLSEYEYKHPEPKVTAVFTKTGEIFDESIPQAIKDYLSAVQKLIDMSEPTIEALKKGSNQGGVSAIRINDIKKYLVKKMKFSLKKL